MLVKYLAEDPRINRILHFDAPVNIFKSGSDVLKSGQGGRHSHARLVLYQTLDGDCALKTGVKFDSTRSSLQVNAVHPASGSGCYPLKKIIPITWPR